MHATQDRPAYSWLFCLRSVLYAWGGFAHPASGIVVNANGEVFFVHTGQGSMQDRGAWQVTYLHKDTGGHWVALDTEGKFASAADNRLFRDYPARRDADIPFSSGGAPLVVNRERESLLWERVSRGRGTRLPAAIR